MKNDGKRFKNEELWNVAIKKDFRNLRKEGIDNKDFKKIEKLLKLDELFFIKRIDGEIHIKKL